MVALERLNFTRCFVSNSASDWVLFWQGGESTRTALITRWQNGFRNDPFRQFESCDIFFPPEPSVLQLVGVPSPPLAFAHATTGLELAGSGFVFLFRRDRAGVRGRVVEISLANFWQHDLRANGRPRGIHGRIGARQ